MPFGKKAAKKKEPRWDERKNPPEYVAVDRPPLLEDVSHEGPLRVQVPALKTMSSYVREVVEEDYGWWRYSKLAAPLLFLLLALLVTVLSLSLWQHNGSLKEIKAGVPRDLYHREQYDDDAEGRVPHVDANGNYVYSEGIGNRHRHLRVAYQVMGLLAIIFVYAAYFLRVKPIIRWPPAPWPPCCSSAPPDAPCTPPAPPWARPTTSTRRPGTGAGPASASPTARTTPPST